MIGSLLALAAPALAACVGFVHLDAERPGRVVLPTETAAGVEVVVEADRVVAVGAGVATARGCETTIDLSGRVLTPGLIAVSTALGLIEVSAEQATDDTTGGGDPVHAALRVADAYNPRAVTIPVARRSGITDSVIAPRGGEIAGQAAWVRLAGASQAETVVAPSVAMVAQVGGSSWADGLLRLRELLADTRAFAADPRGYDQNRLRPLSASRLDLEALIPVVRGDLPLLIAADRAADIESLVRFADEESVRLVILGAAEGWLVRESLAGADIPVLVEPYVYGPGSFDQLHARPDNPALLAEAGVPLMIASYGAHHVHLLAQLAGNAVREGLPHDEALRALTSTPADVFGQPDRGRIAPGAAADLVVWASLDPGAPADPLEFSTAVEHLFIGGRDVALESRQTELLERYRTVPQR